MIESAALFTLYVFYVFCFLFTCWSVFTFVYMLRETYIQREFVIKGENVARPFMIYKIGCHKTEYDDVDFSTIANLSTKSLFELFLRTYPYEDLFHHMVDEIGYCVSDHGEFVKNIEVQFEETHNTETQLWTGKRGGTGKEVGVHLDVYV